MDFIKKMFMNFFFIVAGITLSATIFISLFIPTLTFTLILLWEIIIMAAVSTLGSLIFYSKSELSKKQMRIRILCHYLYITVVVFGGAFLWRWVDPGEITQLLVLFLLNTMVYVSVTLANIYKEKKTADTLNERLCRYHDADKEKEDE